MRQRQQQSNNGQNMNNGQSNSTVGNNGNINVPSQSGIMGSNNTVPNMNQNMPGMANISQSQHISSVMNNSNNVANNSANNMNPSQGGGGMNNTPGRSIFLYYIFSKHNFNNSTFNPISWKSSNESEYGH